MQHWPWINVEKPFTCHANSRWPKISVIVPNYNYGSYIEETILSIINQNYPDLELIIIDGGSTDESVNIIKKHAHKISYWVSEKDRGQSHAINKGLAKATGDYVAYLNSDDVYCENALYTLFTDQHVLSGDFVYGNVKIGYSPMNSRVIRTNKNKMALPQLLLFFYNVDFIIPSQTVFIKRAFLQRNQIMNLNEELHYCMDLEWYCRIVLCKPMVYKHAQTIAFFRVNDDTKTRKKSVQMKQEAIGIAYSFSNKLTIKEKRILKQWMLMHRVLAAVYQKGRAFNLPLFIELIKRSPLPAYHDKRFAGLFKRWTLTKLGIRANS